MRDITFEEIEEHICYETYFTAAQGAMEADGDSGDEALERLTICVLVLNNGLMATGEFHYPTSEDVFNRALAHSAARCFAIQKVPKLVRKIRCTSKEKTLETNHG
jgi:hypothetical protein